jgi:DNA-directed RNA polymerase specialized sigma24 family protein
VDLAFDRLAPIDLRQSRIVELRFFGGLSEEEAGKGLALSPRTIRREWRIAKAWLRRSMSTRAEPLPPP